MTQSIRNAIYAIPVPDGLTTRVLAACNRAQERKPVPRILRFVPAAAAAVACLSVALTALLTGEPSAPPPADISVVVPSITTQMSSTAVLSSATTHSTTATVPSTTATTISTSTTTAIEQGAPMDSLLGVIPGRFEAMTEQELEIHYGRRWRPIRLPADMTPAEENLKRGVYYKDEATIAKMPNVWSFLLKQGTIRDGEIIYDMNDSFWISKEKPTRNLSVSVSTSPYPQHLLGDLTRFDSTVEVAGVSVAVHRYADSPYSNTWCHSALATVDGIAYYVSAWEFTEAEFLDILSSLLA